MREPVQIVLQLARYAILNHIDLTPILIQLFKPLKISRDDWVEIRKSLESDIANDNLRKLCPHCKRPLEPITFYAHHAAAHSLEWLAENRKQTTKGAESNIGVVLERLIQLEVNKRQGIEEKKHK